MIGDEKQLPAVVVQSDKNCMVKDEKLNSINLFDLRNSLFERLLISCMKNNWENNGRLFSLAGVFP